MEFSINLNIFVPLKTKVLLYSSLILSHLNYAILVWGYEYERIIKLQNKSIRIISHSKYNAHTEPIFKTLKLIKVKDILTLQELKFYYKYKYNKLPHYLQNLSIRPNSETHINETRIQNEIHLSKNTT